MDIKKSNRRNYLLTCILILLLCITVPLVLYGNGAIDHYSTKHTAVALKIIQDGHLNFNEKREYTNLMDQMPAYYVMMSEILMVTGISYKCLVFTPILLIPYTFVLFSLFYILSKENWLLSSFLTFIMMISGSNGTHKVFMWPHGFGEIIDYSFLILLSIMLKKSKKELPHVFVLLLLLVSIEYMSYDESFILISEIIWALILGLLLYPSLKKLKFSNVLVICFVLYLEFNNFIYNAFLPVLGRKFNEVQDGVYLSFVDRLSKYFFGNNIRDPLDAYFLSYPKSLTYIYVIKYIIIITVLSFTLYLVVYSLRKNYNHLCLVFLLYFLGVTTYVFPRLLLGQLAVNSFFFPFIISLPLIYASHPNRNYKNAVRVICVILLFVTTSSSYILNSNNLVQKDYNEYGYLENTSFWLEDKVPASSTIVSDQLTYGWLFTYKTYYNFMHPSEKNLKYGIFKREHLMDIFLKENNILNQFLVINYKLPYTQMSSWQFFKPFSNTKKIIDSNSNLSKVYTSSDISIYSPNPSRPIPKQTTSP